MYILVCNFLQLHHKDKIMIHYFSPEYVVLEFQCDLTAFQKSRSRPGVMFEQGGWKVSKNPSEDCIVFCSSVAFWVSCYFHFCWSD